MMVCLKALSTLHGTGSHSETKDKIKTQNLKDKLFVYIPHTIMDFYALKCLVVLFLIM